MAAGSDTEALVDTEALAEVVPLGRVPTVAGQVVAAHLQAVLGLSTRVTGRREIPPPARIQARAQLDATPILTALAQDLAPFRLRVGVTAQDLCLPILTYVFGEALVGGRVAVVSAARLAAPTAGAEVGPGGAPGRGLERLAKVALHEAAHALGVAHCREPGCLMVFSAGLKHLDRLYPQFCSACELRLSELRRGLLAGSQASR